MKEVNSESRYRRTIAWTFKSPLRLFFVIFALLAFIEVSIFSAISATVRRASESQAVIHDANDGNLIAKVLKEHFKGIITYTESYARRVLVRSFVKTSDRAALEVVMNEFVSENKDVDRVFITDRNGTLIAVYPTDDLVVGKNFAYRQWFTSVSKADKSIVSEIYRTSAKPQPLVIVIASPVKDADGLLLGYIASQVRIDSFTEWVAKHRPSDHGTIHIIDHNGTIAMNPTPFSADMINIDNVHGFRELIGKASSSTFAQDPVTHDPSLISLLKIDEYGWDVVVSQPVTDVFATANHLSDMLLLIALLSFIILLSLCFKWLNTIRTYTNDQESTRSRIESLNHNLSDQVELLNQSSQRTQTILDNTPLALWCIDNNGIFTFVSGSLLKKLGRNPEQILGQSYFSVNEQLPDAISHTKKALLGEASLMSIQYGDFFLDSTFVPLRNLEGNVTGVIGLATDVTVRHQAELNLASSQERLRDSERQFRLLTDTIPQLAWISDPKGKISFFNQRWVDYTGMDISQSSSPEGARLVHPDEFGDMAASWSSALENETQFETKYRLRRRDGVYRWQLARALPLRDSTGNVVSWFGTCTDIHEQVLEQQAVLITNQRFKAVISSLDVIIFSADRDGIVDFYEGRGMQSAGVKSDDRIGKSLLKMYPPDHPVHMGLQATLAGESRTIETKINEVWFEITTSPILDIDGTIVGVAGVANNTDIRKKLEIEVIESKTRLQSVIETSPIIMWAIDDQGTITLAEGSALKNLGLNPGYGVGSSVFSIVGENSEIADLIRAAMRGDTVFGKVGFGSRFFESTLSPIKDPTGTVVGVNGMSNDVTERKRSEESHREMEIREQAALQSAKTKSEFLANMSHEIRTPINGVIGMTGLLLDTPLSQDQRDYADSVRISADALLTVINDILDFSKIEAGKLEFESIDFSLTHMIRDIEKTFVHMVSKKGLVLVVEDSLGERCYYKGDPGRIRQVITNLMSNAIKFTKTGNIWLSIKHAGVESLERNIDTLRFEVRDSGIGIPESALHRLFKAFSQADASTSRKFGGTGLGLSICKHLVEIMGGEIGVTSVEGEGSKFSFTIRLQNIPASQMQMKTKNVVIPLSENHVGKRILLAEDNIINQKVAVAMLEKMGYRVQAVANGKEALEALKLINFDLVLMDCQMPEMDGYEAAAQIRLLTPAEGSQIPIVAMTANAFKEDRDKCIASGMNDYVSKPVKAVDLATMIDKWMNNGTVRKIA